MVFINPLQVKVFPSVSWYCPPLLEPLLLALSAPLESFYGNADSPDLHALYYLHNPLYSISLMIILKFRAIARSLCPFVHNWISVYAFLSRSPTVDEQVSSSWMFVFAEFVVFRHADLDPIYDISLYQNQMFLSSCFGTYDCKTRCGQSKTDTQIFP